MLVVVFNRRYKINSEYACYNISIVPYDKLLAYNLEMENSEALLAFLDEGIYNDVTSAKTEIKLTTSGDFIAEKLSIPEENMLILFEETMFKESGEPLLLTKSYFRPEYYDFHVNRRRHSM
jgi:DNA-binding GntR family transcriptional regulator